MSDANEEVTVWTPDAAESGGIGFDLYLKPGDTLDIVAPSAGGVIKSTIVVKKLLL